MNKICTYGLAEREAGKLSSIVGLYEQMNDEDREKFLKFGEAVLIVRKVAEMPPLTASDPKTA